MNTYVSPEQSNLRGIFKDSYRYPNIITPDVIEYFPSKNNDLIAELSNGEGMERGSIIYGTTFVNVYHRNYRYWDANKSFHDIQEAKDYIDEILSLETTPQHQHEDVSL